MRTDALVQHFDQDEHDHHLQITRRVSKVSPARSLLLSESTHFNVMLMHKAALLMPHHPCICCWRHIFQAEKSGKTNPPGWTHRRSKKGKPFAGCNHFQLLSLQRKIFLQLLERGKEENWGVEFVWVTPGPSFSFFVSYIFLFFCLFFSFFLQANSSFLQPISGHAPLPLHKKTRSMILKTTPLPSVATIN